VNYNGHPITHLRYDGLLPPHLTAAFTLKSFQRNSAGAGGDGLAGRLAEQLGFGSQSVARAQQVHSGVVSAVDRPGISLRTDGMATATPGLLLTVVTADCLPLYLWSRDGTCLALIHAGWRGSAQGIARRGVEVLKDKFGTNPGSLGALLGPSICASCYEVGPEVAAAFPPEDLKPGRGDRCHLDLRAVNRRQLREAGLPAENIIVDTLCTRCRSDLLCSYRAQGVDCGRLIAALGLRGFHQ
jgi:hypothetical protein